MLGRRLALAVVALLVAAHAFAQQTLEVVALPAGFTVVCDGPTVDETGAAVDLARLFFTFAFDGGTKTPAQADCRFPFMVGTLGAHRLEIRAAYRQLADGELLESDPLVIDLSVSLLVRTRTRPPTNGRITITAAGVPSVSGTAVPPAAAIADAAGNVWTIRGGNEVDINGVHEPGAGSCQQLLWLGGQLYAGCADATGVVTWWRFDGPRKWTGIGATRPGA